MNRLPIENCWYADGTPKGRYVGLHPDHDIEVMLGELPLPAGGNPLFIVCAEVEGRLVAAGKGHNDGHAWLWNGLDTWIDVLKGDPALDTFETYGNTPCAFGPLGLYVSIPGTLENVRVYDPLTGAFKFALTKPIGARGIALVDGDGDTIDDIHPQDAWYGQHGLAEFIDLGELQIGQGAGGGCWVVKGDYRRELEPGDVQAIHVHQEGALLSVAMWKRLEKRAVVIWLTVAEALSLPEGEPVMSDRFWFHPNIASRDLVTLFDDPATLAGIDVFQVFVQNVIFDGANQGPNTSQALQANHVYQKLKQAGIPLSIEMGSVKPGDCQAVNALHNLAWAVGLVREQKGEVAYVSMDEPLTADKDGCHQGAEKTADAMAAFVQRGAALNVKIGWIEAWPHITFVDQQRFLALLKARTALPAFWHLDIDWNRAASLNLDPARFIRDAQQLADSYGITLGIYLNTTIDPLMTDAAHHANVLMLAQKVLGLVPNPPRLIVASWAFRTGGIQDLPANLGVNGQLATYAQVRTLFAGGTVEPPIPEPEPQIPSTTEAVVYTDPTKEVITVKAIKPVAGTKLVTLILPSGRVYSCQPDGSAGDRDPGTEGGYEKCRVTGNLVTFKPVDKYFTKAFVEVEGL